MVDEDTNGTLIDLGKTCKAGFKNSFLFSRISQTPLLLICRNFLFVFFAPSCCVNIHFVSIVLTPFCGIFSQPLFVFRPPSLLIESSLFFVGFIPRIYVFRVSLISLDMVVRILGKPSVSICLCLSVCSHRHLLAFLFNDDDAGVTVICCWSSSTLASPKLC
jgi:hypothetical protein